MSAMDISLDESVHAACSSRCEIMYATSYTEVEGIVNNRRSYGVHNQLATFRIQNIAYDLSSCASGAAAVRPHGMRSPRNPSLA